MSRFHEKNKIKTSMKVYSKRSSLFTVHSIVVHEQLFDTKPDTYFNLLQ